MKLKNRRKAGDSSVPALGASPSPLHPDAAGIDLAATDCVVAVPPDRDSRPIRTFLLTTDGLRTLCDWLLQCRVKTVAVEATGNYWVPLYDILDEAGIEVWLCNARHAKGVPGHKSDVQDAEWLRQLHTAGLLRRSYRPDKEVRPLRYLLRHRASLVKSATRCEQHMQKVLNELNLRLHHVISDLTGATGTRILDAIEAGQRDPAILAKLKDPRCQASEAELIAALTGNYQSQYLFVLKQSRDEHRYIQKLIGELDAQLAGLMSALPAAPLRPVPPAKGDSVAASTPAATPAKTETRDAVIERGPMPKIPPAKAKLQRNTPEAPIWEEAWRVFGVDLSGLPGVSANVISVLMAEVGGAEHFKAHFSTSERFCSWLGLCPDNRVSGGKRLSAKTRKVSNRLAQVLRLGALAASYSESTLGDFARRMKARLGKAEGVTATAHKIARILYALITTGQAYDEAKAFAPSLRAKSNRLSRLNKQAKILGMQLVPI
jgi:transposase